MLLGIVDSGRGFCNTAGLEPRAVSVAAAGFIHRSDGVLLESPNINWHDVPIVGLLRHSTGLPVFLDNDATAAAAGEEWLGAGRGMRDFVFLTLGTGIGGGAFVEGNLLRGHRGTAAEFGHLVVDRSGHLCGCGRRGCLETMASGTALVREAVRFSLEDRGSALHTQAALDRSSVTGEAVAAAAKAGDKAAVRAFNSISYYLGLGIVDLIHIFDPEAVMLGGGVSGSADLFLDGLRAVIVEHGIQSLVKDVPVLVSSLGDDAGLIGAARIAWKDVYAGD